MSSVILNFLVKPDSSCLNSTPVHFFLRLYILYFPIKCQKGIYRDYYVIWTLKLCLETWISQNKIKLFQDQHLFQILLHHHNLQTSQAHQRARAQPQRVQARGLHRGVLVRIILKNSKQTRKGRIRKNSKQTKRGRIRKNSKQTKRGRIQRLLIPEVRQGQQPEVEIVVRKWKLNGLHPEMNLMSNLSMA